MREESKFTTLESYGFGPNVMKKMKVCPACGCLAKYTASYCPECGGVLPDTLYERYRQQHTCCESCGEVLAQDARYCPACGKAVVQRERRGSGEYEGQNRKGGV